VPRHGGQGPNWDWNLFPLHNKQRTTEVVRKLIAGITFAAAIAPTILAAAETRHRMLPPEHYDHPYNGELKIVRHETLADIQAACPTIAAPLACAKVLSASQCEIHLPPDYMYPRYSVTADVIMRHEIGHCNGWKHDPETAITTNGAPKPPVSEMPPTNDDAAKAEERKETPAVRKRTPLEEAKLTYEVALQDYNGSKVRTRKHYNYIMELRAKWAAEFRRDGTPPKQYDVPYTGKLTIERIDDAEALDGEKLCMLKPMANRVGCAVGPANGSWCTVYIASDALLKKKYPSADTRKLFGLTYDEILRHELAHCNGWPADHDAKPGAAAASIDTRTRVPEIFCPSGQVTEPCR
jgi:hypothetical protein